MIALIRDFRHAGLSAEEVALMAFAQKVIVGANQVVASDLDELRSFGLSDEEILDVIQAVAARSFFSKVLDATGANPDAAYGEQLEPEILELISPGGKLS